MALCAVGWASKPGVKKAPAKLPTNPMPEMKMIHIPAGSFLMGTPDSYTGAHSKNEHPQHTITLSAYTIGKYEVTVAQYRKFCKATGRQMPKEPSWGWKGNYPITHVTWNDASAFCKWAGGRLPTEAEWEKAARGTDGRIYPWGNTWDKNKCATSGAALTSRAPVGSYPRGASPYGCQDMAGNVWEWCSDWYGKTYYETSPSRNPKGPSSGDSRVLRGGSWDNTGNGTRCACRNYYYPSDYNYYLGFRLAR